MQRGKLYQLEYSKNSTTINFLVFLSYSLAKSDNLRLFPFELTNLLTLNFILLLYDYIFSLQSAINVLLVEEKRNHLSYDNNVVFQLLTKTGPLETLNH